MTFSAGLSKRALAAGATALGLILLATIAVAFSARHTRHLRRAPAVAYLVPIGGESRIRTWFWTERELSLPLTIRSGDAVKLPAGSRAMLVRPRTGAVTTVTGPLRIFFEEQAPDETNDLVSPLSEIQAKARARVDQAASFAITSPVGVTRFLNPTLCWTAQPGIRYDIAVADAADPYVPLRRADKVRPPISLAELETPQRRQLGTDRNYEILVREEASQGIAGIGRCLTLPDAKVEAQLPSTPEALVAEAVSAMAQKPYRTGDAWLALSHLSPAWRTSELGLRLRLCVAVELNLKSELLAALADGATLFGK